MRLFALLSAMMLPTAVFAGFGIAKGASTPPPDDGFSSIAEYDDAANGKTILSPAEQREITSFASQPINHTYYVRAEYQQSTVKINGVKQYPSPTYNTIPNGGIESTVTQTSSSRSATPYGLVWGYKSVDWRYELMYYHLPKVDYVANPVLNTPNPNTGDYVNATGSNGGHEVLVNFIRDFPMVFYVSPYIGVGVGLGYQTTKMTQTDATTGAQLNSKTNNNIQPNFQAEIGLRLRLLETLWINGAYRYFYLHEGMRTNVGDISLKASNETTTGVVLGLDWQF